MFMSKKLNNSASIKSFKSKNCKNFKGINKLVVIKYVQKVIFFFYN